MSNILQIALFIASVAFTVLMVCLIPIVFQVKRQLDQLVITAGELKEKTQALVEDSHQMVHNVTEIAKRANQELDEVHHILQTVHQWTERTDRLVNEVGSAIEPPVHLFTRNMTLLRTGLAAFAQAFLHRYQRKPTNEE